MPVLQLGSSQFKVIYFMRLLSKQQIDDFYNIGYIFLKDFFSTPEVAEMSEAINSLQEMAKDLEGEVMHKGSKFVIQDGLLERVVWAGAAEPSLLMYGRDPKLTSLAAQILDSMFAEHLINQVHFKLPGGGFYRWHQDSTHRGYGNNEYWCDANGKGSYVQTVTAIDEATSENGPLFVIPYSCQKGHLSLPYDKNGQTVSDKFNPADAVPVLMKPGDIVAFGPYTIHGSEINNSDRPRRAFINGYAHLGANGKEYPGPKTHIERFVRLVGF